MTSQIGQQIITTHVSPNISRSKGNKAMEFGQLIKYCMIGNLVPDHCKVKASDQHFSFHILFW